MSLFPDPYRILHLASYSEPGGTERMILELVRRLDRTRFDPLVMTLVGSGAWTAECRRLGIHAEHVDCAHPLDWRAWRRVYKTIRDQRVDLVHLYGLRANLPGRPLAKWAGARAVVAGIRSTDPWRKWYHSALDRWTARWVDLFISNSEAGRQAAIRRERFDPDRIVTVHSGIDPRRIAERFDRPALRERFGIDPGAHPVVSFVANLRRVKRHRDVINAAALLLPHFPAMVFLCAGRDEMHGENQHYAQTRGVAGAFRWLGYVEDVESVIAVGDFTVLPSSYEGLPASILEAMAMHRTVIATPVGGIREIVRHEGNGLLVPVADPSALARAIALLAADSDLRSRLEDAALYTVQRDFSMERMVGDTQRLYLDLIEGPQPY